MSVLTRRNLCPNPSFEVDTSSWGLSGASGTTTLTRDTTAGYFGPSSLRIDITASTGTTTFGAYVNISALTVGQTYTVSGYVKTLTTSNLVSIYVNSYGPQGGNSFSWSRISNTFVANATTQTIFLINQVNGSGASDTMWWDAILIEAVGSAQSYFDGSTSGASWDGTAGKSTSSIYKSQSFTAVPDDNAGRVLIQAVYALGSTVTITRTDPDGSITPIRDCTGVALSGSAWSGYDYEAPIGAKVTYTAVNDLGTVQTVTAATGDLTNGKIWLKHPLKPYLNQLLTAVEGIPEVARSANRSLHIVYGRPNPVALSMKRSSSAGTLSFYTQDYAGAIAQTIDAQLDDGVPLLLQVPVAASNAGNRYVLIGDSAKGFVVSDPLDGLREYVLPFTTVAKPLGSAAGGAGDTWGDLRANFTGWGQVKALEPSWSAVKLKPSH